MVKKAANINGKLVCKDHTRLKRQIWKKWFYFSTHWHYRHVQQKWHHLFHICCFSCV